MYPETYFIPANFTDAGRVFGLFPLRNIIEAVVLGLPWPKGAVTSGKRSTMRMR